MRLLWALLAVFAVLFSLVTANQLQSGRAIRDVETLVGFGARVSGSTNLEVAAKFLQSEYQKVGLKTEIELFSFERLRDFGSSVTAGSQKLAADTLYSSQISDIEGLAVRVPNFGSKEDYQNLSVKARVVLVKRGGIPFLEKARAAQAAGAIAVVIVNSVPGRLSANLLGDFAIPVVAVSGADGTPLLEQVAKNAVRLRVIADVRRTSITGRNVVARGSDAAPKLILGAHFDSVPGSPGANDNASGTAAILEMARRLPASLRAQIWFVSFDAEEDGLLGSSAFVQNLPTATLDGLKAMLNFDMVAVNNKISVGGSSSLTKLIRGIQPNIGEFQDFAGSDHASFLAESVPAVFFWRGFEPNYHLPSDSKVDAVLLEETISLGLETVQKLLGQ